MQQRTQSLSLQEWFELPPVQIQKTSQHLGWNTANMQIAKLSPTPEQHLSPIPDDLILNMVVAGHTKLYSHLKNLGLNASGEIYHPGMINCIPPGFQTDGSWDSYFTVGFWFFSRQALADLATQTSWGDPQQLEIFPKFHFQDSLLHHLLLAILSELNQDSLFGTTYVDSLAQTAMLHLLKNYSNAQRVILPTKNTLSPSQKSTLEAYIEAHLTDKLTLPELARLLHISVPHLERCFRQTYGMPIYRFIINRRIERAKILLFDPYKSLYDVALECGFASQSHFNRHFKACVGVTPTQYMQAR